MKYFLTQLVSVVVDVTAGLIVLYIGKWLDGHK